MKSIQPEPSEPVDDSWTDDVLLGDDALDADHRLIFNLMRQLETARSERAPEATVEAVLARLTDHIGAHFAREEQFMRACGYPQLAGHAEEHAAFITDLAQIQHDLAHEPTQVADRAFRFVRQWFTGHVKGADRALAYFVAQDGQDDPRNDTESGSDALTPVEDWIGSSDPHLPTG